MSLLRRLSLLAALILPALALAEESAATPAPAEAPETAAPAPEPAELQSVLTAARDAAVAAKEAAEAARDATTELKAALAAQAGAKPAEGEKKPEEKAKEEKKKSAFTYQLGLGLIAVTGNANAVTGKVSGGVEGDWQSWAIKALASAAYGQTTAEATSLTEVTALNGALTLRGDRKVSKKFSIYVLTGVSADHLASIEAAGLGEVGASLVWFKTMEGDFVKSSLATDLGFRFTHESRFQYYPVQENIDNIDIYSPRLALTFRYAISKTAVFTEEAEILPDLVNTKNLRATSTSTLTAQLGSGVSFNVAFKVRHIGDPAEDKKPTDTELSAGVSWAF